MLKVGITGGIGSGKSTVCKIFETLGIPVFYADEVARDIMNTDEELKQAIQQQFGADTYINGVVNRKRISELVFNNPEKLALLNSLVHPATIKAGNDWAAAQDAPYTLKEAAILFESGSYKALDKIIGVSAPENIRLQRTMARDHISEEDVRNRMARQMDEAEKMNRCDFVILNDDTTAVIQQVLDVHTQLLQLSHGL
jgi:dephospho-CoA kinase